MAHKLASGIYAILDLDRIAPLLPEDADEEFTTLMRYANDAVEAGAVALQLRAKSVPGHSLFLPTLVQKMRAALDDRVPLILNDHVQALEPITERDGLGVHLGQDDDTPQHARSRLGDAVLVGWSTHNLTQVAQAAAMGADYIGFGPVNPTESKDRADPVTGMDKLAEAVANAAMSVVAIGGLQVEDIAAVQASGARCAAVIGAWLGDDGAPNGPNFARMAMQELVAAWRKARDAS